MSDDKKKTGFEQYERLPLDLRALTEEYTPLREQLYVNTMPMFPQMPTRERMQLVDRLLVKILDIGQTDILVLKVSKMDEPQRMALTHMMNGILCSRGKPGVINMVVSEENDVALVSSENAGELLKRRVQQLTEENKKLRAEIAQLQLRPATPPVKPPSAS